MVCWNVCIRVFDCDFISNQSGKTFKTLQKIWNNLIKWKKFVEHKIEITADNSVFAKNGVEIFLWKSGCNIRKNAFHLSFFLNLEIWKSLCSWRFFLPLLVCSTPYFAKRTTIITTCRLRFRRSDTPRTEGIKIIAKKKGRLFLQATAEFLVVAFFLTKVKKNAV